VTSLATVGFSMELLITTLFACVSSCKKCQTYDVAELSKPRLEVKGNLPPLDNFRGPEIVEGMGMKNKNLTQNGLFGYCFVLIYALSS
jgi:hypothetical protein